MSDWVFQLKSAPEYWQRNRSLCILLWELPELFRTNLRPMSVLLWNIQVGEQPMRRALPLQQVRGLNRPLRLVPPQLHVMHGPRRISVQNLCLRLLPLPINLFPVFLPGLHISRRLRQSRLRTVPMGLPSLHQSLQLLCMHGWILPLRWMVLFAVSCEHAAVFWFCSSGISMW